MTDSVQDPQPKEGVYRLERFDVEIHGRQREFRRSIIVFALLILVQLPLRADALKSLDKTPDIDPVVSLRLFLIVNVAFMISYVLVSYRAWGLVRAFRAPRRLALIAKATAYVLIPILVTLDASENIYLWLKYSGNDAINEVGWRVSEPVIHLGVATAIALNVTLAFVANPDLYWDRDQGSLIRRFKLLSRPMRWVATDEELSRWNGLLVSLPDDGSCSCGGTITRAPDSPVKRDWGVICCSGGGVRSAAFSLGALQVLNARNLYEKTAAVIGVSGGGYTSTAYHVMRWQSGDTVAEDANHDKVWTLPTGQAFTPPSPELHWLRRHTHYVLDSVRVAIDAALALAFGIAVNLILLAVAIGATAWLLAWLYLASGTITLPTEKFATLKDEGSRVHLDVGGHWWALEHTLWLALAGLTLFLVDRAWDRFETVPRRLRVGMRQMSTWLIAAGVVLWVLFVGLPTLITTLFDYADTSGSPYAKLIYSLGFVPQEHCEAVLNAPGTTAACGEHAAADAGAKGISAASIAVVVTSILTVLASVRAASKSPVGGSGAKAFFGKLWSKVKNPLAPWGAVSIIALVCLVQLARWTAILTTQPARLDDWQYAQGGAVVLLALKVFTEPNRTSLHHFFRERISYAFLVRRRFRKIEPLPYREPLRFSRSRPPDLHGPRLVTCAVANATDPTLVPSERGCTPFVFDDDAIGLTDRLLPAEAARRRSATYEFAADHRYRDATIPAAVAMSAAAFSPLAGRENVRLGPYRAALALGNARLGVWLPNPLWVDPERLARRQAGLRDPDFAKTWNSLSCQEAGDLWAKLGSARPWARKVCEDAAPQVALRHIALWGDVGAADSTGSRWVEVLEFSRMVFKKPGITRVVREAVGRASIYDRFVYVTDGGHYDNLGLVEALRRKPQRIFAIDASNDAEDTFRALGLAVATARMDLDCEIDLDPRPMRRLEDPRAAAAWSTGVATFADGSTCAIYLVKAIMLNDMPWDVETYAGSNLNFPRTSTGKQLYSEFDFEAYRMLGMRAAKKLLGSPEYLKQEAKLDEPTGHQP